MPDEKRKEKNAKESLSALHVRFVHNFSVTEKEFSVIFQGRNFLFQGVKIFRKQKNPASFEKLKLTETNI